MIGGIVRGRVDRVRNTRSGPCTPYSRPVSGLVQFPHFPFQPHRNPPQEIGYEFYLLTRFNDKTSPTLIRKWTFTTDEVIQNNPRYPSVKHPFQETVELSNMIDTFAS
jgi:hypothetical protein